jgi:hypothetical protein
MDGRPEGTEVVQRRRPAWLGIVVLLFALYLGYRLLEGVVWLIGRF